MIRETIEGKNGYAIPYISETDINARGKGAKILLAAHGIGSSKESPNVKMLMRELPKRGIGVVAFDFPAHGESPVDGERLSVENCVNDLNSVARHVREAYPDAEICYFGSSFGAYITMIYLTEYGIRGAKVFLRSAAVDMDRFFEDLTPEQATAMERNGYVMSDDIRPLKITRTFVEDLGAHDLFELFKGLENDIVMIHGTDDEDVAYASARSFSEKFGIPLVTVEGGDHRLSIPGAPERVLKETLSLLE